MRLLVIAIVCVSLVAFGSPTVAAPKGIPFGTQEATVRSVVNGDTYRVTLDDGTRTTVSLLDVDAPDPTANDPAASCYGEVATQQVLKTLKPGRHIWLEKDTTNKDKAQHLLRYVWVAKSSGGVYLLNEVLLRDGYAVFAPTGKDTEYNAALQQANSTAQAAGRGLWFACQEYRVTPTPEPTAVPTAVPTATATPVAIEPIPYTVVDVEDNSFGSRVRFSYQILVDDPSGYSEADMIATFVAALHQAFGEHPDAKVVIVFAYLPNTDIGAGVTFGRAAASTDRKGWAGDGKLLSSRKDDGRAEVYLETYNATDGYVEDETLHLVEFSPR